MSEKAYERELAFLGQTVTEAFAAHGKMEKVTDKTAFDLVTDADVAIERHVTRRIREEFPGDGILGEEDNPKTAVGGRTWTVDPIDGTVNMAHSIRLFGVQCSLTEDFEPVVSVIYLPVFGELYSAVNGRGAFCGEKRLRAAKREPEKAIVSFGDLSHTHADDFTDQMRMMFYLSPKVSKLRMLGCAAVDFAALAAGKLDGTVFFTKNLWDLAPGMLLAKEAGCEICSPEGGYTPDSRAIIIASTHEIAELIRESY